MTRAHGIDISKYVLSFDPAKATGQLDFVIQRVSYRTTWDELFASLVPGVMKVGIRGAYHYLNSDTSWKAQADFFLSVVKDYDFQFYACDFESAYNIMSTAFAYQAWEFIQYVKSQTSKNVFLYTSPSLYNAWIGPSESLYAINWNSVPLWQAQWYYIEKTQGRR